MTSLTVLTGDIIGSSDLGVDLLGRALDELEAAIAALAPVTGVTRFSLRGGDGWQAAMDRPELDLRAALLCQARLRAVGAELDTRIAIARGDGEVTDDLNRAHGPAFTESGRLLERIRHPARMRHAEGGARDAATALADHIAADWTEAQARAAALALVPDQRTRSDFATELGISRQAVNQALWSGGFRAIDQALKALEAT